jgi:excisionase family DNA binding protein
MPNNVMMTTSEVARIFNVNASTVRRWISNGKIKTCRNGNKGAHMFLRENIAILYLDRSIRSCLKGYMPG